MSTTRAKVKCGKWLAYCLQIGWSRTLLDDLERLWWKYHDEHGNFKQVEP